MFYYQYKGLRLCAFEGDLPFPKAADCGEGEVIFLFRRAPLAGRDSFRVADAGLFTVEEGPESLTVTAPAEVDAELARAAFVTPQAMQGVLANLERDGLLKRTAHPDHGRILRNELTAEGRQALGQARLHVQDIEGLLSQAVGQENAALFAEALARCADALTPA